MPFHARLEIRKGRGWVLCLEMHKVRHKKGHSMTNLSYKQHKRKPTPQSPEYILFTGSIFDGCGPFIGPFSSSEEAKEYANRNSLSFVNIINIFHPEFEIPWSFYGRDENGAPL